jgi:hypothetical protein
MGVPWDDVWAGDCAGTSASALSDIAVIKADFHKSMETSLP